MSTNNDIRQGFSSILLSADLGYPISFPGGVGADASGNPAIGFTPPSSGYWLECSFFPNQGLDRGLAYDDTVIPRGMYQISCVTRPGSGAVGLGSVAKEIWDTFPKGTTIHERVRVIREPYDFELDSEDDRMIVVVSIEYSG